MQGPWPLARPEVSFNWPPLMVSHAFPIIRYEGENGFQSAVRPEESSEDHILSTCKRSGEIERTRGLESESIASPLVMRGS